MSNLKWRGISILVAFLVSVYLVVPSLLGWFDPEGKLPLKHFFPNKGVNLGLDLRGGLYVEMEVDLPEAIKNRIDIQVMQIEKAAEGKFKDLKLESTDHETVKVFLDANYRSDFWSFVSDNYDNVFKLVDNVNDPTYMEMELSAAYRDQLISQTLKQAVEAVRNRIDRYGVSEAGIQLQGSDRIEVEIPGVTDPDRVINVIRKTGMLQFRMVDETVKSSDLSTWIKDARAASNIPEGYSKEIVDQLNAAIKDKLPQDTEVLFEVSRDPVTKEIVDADPYVISKQAPVTGDMLRNAQVGIHNNEPHVSLSFNKIGTKNFGELTKANVGKRLAIVLDGFVNKAPVIQTGIMDGEAQITLGYGNYQSLSQEAEDLALLLREGALPATLNVATKTVIGPSLGADSIRQGLMSMLWATVVIVIFMMGYYKWSGVVANVALLLNVVMLFGIMALLQASLSLPGIAGIVLTLGMAVDANIIVFERMKEEMRHGKSAKLVVESSYMHAMSAIVDSNLTTLFAGIVLFQFGTGPIKGFATTLMIGIVTTMFTAIFVTRVIYDYFIVKKKIARVSI